MSAPIQGRPPPRLDDAIILPPGTTIDAFIKQQVPEQHLPLLLDCALQHGHSPTRYEFAIAAADMLSSFGQLTPDWEPSATRPAQAERLERRLACLAATKYVRRCFASPNAAYPGQLPDKEVMAKAQYFFLTMVRGLQVTTQLRIPHQVARAHELCYQQVLDWTGQRIITAAERNGTRLFIAMGCCGSAESVRRMWDLSGDLFRANGFSNFSPGTVMHRYLTLADIDLEVAHFLKLADLPLCMAIKGSRVEGDHIRWLCATRVVRHHVETFFVNIHAGRELILGINERDSFPQIPLQGRRPTVGAWHVASAYYQVLQGAALCPRLTAVWLHLSRELSRVPNSVLSMRHTAGFGCVGISPCHERST